MKTFTIDTDNNITVHASRKAARETGAGVFATEEQLAELIGPDNKRLVEIWNSLAGVKPVTKFANRKAATERIWKALQSLGEQAAAPVPETPFDVPGQEVGPADLPVSEPEHANAEASRPLEDATLQAEIEPVALTAPVATEAVIGTVANVGAQEPLGALAEQTAPENTNTRQENCPRPRRQREPAKSKSAMGRARAARRRRWSPCSAARTAPRWRRSWTRWAGSGTPSAGSWPAR